MPFLVVPMLQRRRWANLFIQRIMGLGSKEHGPGSTKFYFFESVYYLVEVENQMRTVGDE